MQIMQRIKYVSYQASTYESIQVLMKAIPSADIKIIFYIVLSVGAIFNLKLEICKPV